MLPLSLRAAKKAKESACLRLPPSSLIPHQSLHPTSKWAIGAIAFAVCGILTNVGVLLVYVRYNDTPVVRASGRELSYVILLGRTSLRDCVNARFCIPLNLFT